MKRAEGLDTYYGEGLFYPNKKPWDFIYFKIAHGKKSFFHPVDDFTKRIVEASEGIPIKGAYSYLLADNQKSHWKAQADAYLEAARYIEDIMGIEIDMDIPDIEGTYNKRLYGRNWTYSSRFGSMIYEWINYVRNERGKPVLPYMNKSTYHECFIWHGYNFIKDENLIIANYPYRKWNNELLSVPTDADKWNPALPAGKTGWQIWQYSDGYPSNGITDSKAIDVNVWNGTREDMLNWFGIDDDSPPAVDDYDRGKQEGLNLALRELEHAQHNIEGAKP
jgi:hypothetical protein